MAPLSWSVDELASIFNTMAPFEFRYLLTKKSFYFCLKRG